MGEYASKGIAGTALGVGIGGLAVALMNGGRLAGSNGLFGNSNSNLQQAEQMTINQVLAQKDATIARLEGQRYTDEHVQDIYNKSAADDKELRQDILSTVAPINTAVSDLQARVLVLEKETECHEKTANLQLQLMQSNIDKVAMQSANGINCLNTALANTNATLSQITQLYVPAAQVTPTPMQKYNSWTAPTTTASTGS